MQTQCISDQLEFETFDGRRVVAGFDGGLVTSDAGALLLREADHVIGLIDRVAKCFSDRRDQADVVHPVRTLVGQRIVGIALGYEDVNDHDALRFDPVVGLFSEGLDRKRKDCAPLAGKSTINRLEHAPSGDGDRYHKIGHDPKALETLFVDVFLDTHAKAPREIVIDLDATDDPLHGHQQGFTVITIATAICRCTFSVARICWRRSCAAPTSTPRPAPRTKWPASSPTSAAAGRG